MTSLENNVHRVHVSVSTCPVALEMRGTLAISGEIEGSFIEDEKSNLLLPPLLSFTLCVCVCVCLCSVCVCVCVCVPPTDVSSTVNLASSGTAACKIRNGWSRPTVTHTHTDTHTHTHTHTHPL